MLQFIGGIFGSIFALKVHAVSDWPGGCVSKLSIPTHISGPFSSPTVQIHSDTDRMIVKCFE